MELGISSYTYTWSVGVPGSLPAKQLSANDLIDRAAASGLTLVQIADNLPVELLKESELMDLKTYGKARGVKIEMVASGINSFWAEEVEIDTTRA